MLISSKFNFRILSYLSRHFTSKVDILTKEDYINRLKMDLPVHRKDPVIMKLESPEFRSIFTPELESLEKIFKKYNYELRIAGGAVRDLLMGIQPKDLDFATTATPTEMKKIFETEKVRLINANGEKHGTITPRINDKENFEVTTLRIDVTTDGRHAEVIFTTDWLLDALRRDLTINSMFLGFDGSVYDYFFGYEDLQKRRIAFVGSATKRIQEDYLRILRYFRFFGRISDDTVNNHETKTLQAIKDNAEGLKRISGERIWMELKKILEGNYGGQLMVTIVDCGLSEYIGLPNNPKLGELERVNQQCSNLKLNAITLLSTLLNNVQDVHNLNGRLKLSAFERDLAYFIVEHREPKLHPNPLLPYKQLIVKTKSNPTVTKKYVVEILKYNNSTYIEEFTNWEIPQFPVGGAMLKEKGVENGRMMGLVIQELKNIWADNEFKMSVDEILNNIPMALDKLHKKKIKSKIST